MRWGRLCIYPWTVAALALHICTYLFSKLGVWFCSAWRTEVLECRNVISRTQLLCVHVTQLADFWLVILYNYTCTNNSSLPSWKRKTRISLWREETRDAINPRYLTPYSLCLEAKDSNMWFIKEEIVSLVNENQRWFTWLAVQKK